jgi:tetratricopeptide (TPR) repeat protein
MAKLSDSAEALNRLKEAEQLLDRLLTMDIIFSGVWASFALGRASLILGEPRSARSFAGAAIEFSRGNPGSLAHALHLLGDIALHPDQVDADSCEGHYRKALALAQPRGMYPLMAHCHLGLGRLYQRTGNREQARKHLTTATSMYREMDMRFYLEQAEAESTLVASASVGGEHLRRPHIHGTGTRGKEP